MGTIDISEKFLSSFNSLDIAENEKVAKLFIQEIEKDEKQLEFIKHYYLSAYALYFYLLRQQDQETLSPEKSASIIKWTYYCLLENYLNNKNVVSHDVIKGSELAVIVLCKDARHIITLLTNTVGCSSENAQKHLENQKMLFGGVVKEADEKGTTYRINDYFSKMFDGLYNESRIDILTGNSFQILKKQCISSMSDIVSKLEADFK